MPGLDGTGPEGLGPRTGRGIGFLGYGPRGGTGRFCRRQPFRTSITKKEELEILERDAKDVKADLEAINERMEELKNEK